MLSKTRKKGSQLRHSTSACAGGRAKPELSDDYIVGLVDGEGCFYVSISESARYRAGARVLLSLHIKMQARDREVLNRVAQTIGCGSVYFQKESRPNHTQCYRYTVGSHNDILTIIVPFFKRHPLQTPSKSYNFDIFCKIAQIVKNNEHLNKQGINRIKQLKQQMNQRTSGLA
ncbi:MAG: LAGLIDADG family homing endonuclease [bacterium]|nr:LAGLIDADG family homing endonuclease [bacterium]